MILFLMYLPFTNIDWWSFVPLVNAGFDTYPVTVMFSTELFISIMFFSVSFP